MRRITPDMPREVAQKIAIEESGDIRARWKLIDLAEDAFYNGDKHAAASLMHACDYLQDRVGYERNPPPKNMILLPVPNPSPSPAPSN